MLPTGTVGIWLVAVPSEAAPANAKLRYGRLAEYRLNELARASGVSARNIRAYRERGLLDPPRREGRSAYYDDFHLAQLETIDQLLRKGFTSAHIGEFFASMRAGHDLADLLGLQRAVLGPRPEHEAEAESPDSAAQASETVAVDLDPDGDEARRLCEQGLAEIVDGAVVLVDHGIADIIARAPDRLRYVQTLLQIADSTREPVDELATAVVAALEHCVTSRFGPNFVPKPDETAELSQFVNDYRELASKVITNHLDTAVHERLVTAVSDYTAGILLSGRWEQQSPPGD